MAEAISSINENYSENIEVLKQVVEKGEEATTSLERLSYLKPNID